MSQERMKEIGQKLDVIKKDNEDLKYDNTLLYEKNI